MSCSRDPRAEGFVFLFKNKRIYASVLLIGICKEHIFLVNELCVFYFYVLILPIVVE